jgi:hypothetical protein
MRATCGFGLEAIVLSVAVRVATAHRAIFAYVVWVTVTIRTGTELSLESDASVTKWCLGGRVLVGLQGD